MDAQGQDVTVDAAQVHLVMSTHDQGRGTANALAPGDMLGAAFPIGGKTAVHSLAGCHSETAEAGEESQTGGVGKSHQLAPSGRIRTFKVTRLASLPTLMETLPMLGEGLTDLRGQARTATTQVDPIIRTAVRLK